MRYKILLLFVVFMSCNDQYQDKDGSLKVVVKDTSTDNDTTIHQDFRVWGGGKWEMTTRIVVEGPYDRNNYNMGYSGSLTKLADGSYRIYYPLFDTTVIGGFDSIRTVIKKFYSIAINKLTVLKKEKERIDSLIRIRDLRQKKEADTLIILNSLSNKIKKS